MEEGIKNLGVHTVKVKLHKDVMATLDIKVEALQEIIINGRSIVKKYSYHSYEAEQAVIGSMIMDPDAVPIAMELINKDDF